MPTLIFVHGACVRDAAWWWSLMEEPLADRGISTTTVPLPSCGEARGTLGDLYDDVGACQRVVADAEGPVILCGHSYGGMIITEAGADDRVRQLLYVTSVMPDNGESQAQLIGSEPAPWLRPGDDGTIGVDPGMVREFFLQDCDQATTEQALARLTRQSLTPFTQPPRRSPGGRSPPPTSCAPKTSRPQPRHSVDVSEPAPDSSSSTLATIRSSRAPTSSRRASLTRSQPPRRPIPERGRPATASSREPVGLALVGPRKART